MENWRDNLTDDSLKTSANLAKYESLEDALHGFDQASGRLGRSITIPSDDAGEDAHKEFVAKLQKNAPSLIPHPDYAEDHGEEFWNMLGKPSDPKEYTPPDDFEGLSTEAIESARTWAEKVGMTKKQFQSTLDVLAEETAGLESAAQAEKDAQAALIAEKWGNAEADKTGAVNALIEKFQDIDHKVEPFSASQMLMLDKIVAAFTGDGPQVFIQPQGSGGLTPEEINDELNAINDRLMKEGPTMLRKTYRTLMEKKSMLLKKRAA